MGQVGLIFNTIIFILSTNIIFDNRIKADFSPVVLWHGMGKKNKIFVYNI